MSFIPSTTDNASLTQTEFQGGAWDSPSWMQATPAGTDAAEEIKEIAFDTAGDFISADNTNIQTLVEAILGDAVSGIAADELLQIEITVKNAINQSVQSSYIAPDFKVVGHESDADRGDTWLQDGIEGAFVSEEDFETENGGGTVLLSNTLLDDADAMNGVALEELGESIASFLTAEGTLDELGVEIAPGDVGARFSATVTGDEIPESTWEASADDTTTVTIDGEDGIAAVAADWLETPSWGNNTNIVTDYLGWGYTEAEDSSRNSYYSQVAGVFMEDFQQEGNSYVHRNDLDSIPGITAGELDTLVAIYGKPQSGIDYSSSNYENEFLNYKDIKQALMDQVLDYDPDSKEASVDLQNVTSDAMTDAIFRYAINKNYGGVNRQVITAEDFDEGLAEVLGNAGVIGTADYQDLQANFADWTNNERGKTEATRFSRHAITSVFSSGYISKVDNAGNEDFSYVDLTLTGQITGSPDSMVHNYAAEADPVFSGFTPDSVAGDVIGYVNITDDRKFGGDGNFGDISFYTIDPSAADFDPLDPTASGQQVIKVVDGEMVLLEDYGNITNKDNLMVTLRDESWNITRQYYDLNDVLYHEVDTGYEATLFSSYLGKPGAELTAADYSDLALEQKIDSAEYGEYGIVEINPSGWTSADILPAVVHVMNNWDTFDYFGAEEEWTTDALKNDLGMTDADIETLRSEYPISHALDSAEIEALTGEVFYLRDDGTVGVNTLAESLDGIPIAESNWVPDDYARDLTQPWDTLFSTYAAPIDLTADWDASNNPVVISHRGVFENAINVPENSLASIEAALSEEGGLNAVEIDVVSTSDGELIVSHDFSPWRQTLLNEGDDVADDRKWSEIHSDDVIGQPIITRNIAEDGTYTGEYTVTDETVMTLDTAMDYGVGINEDAVFYIDARNDDPGRTIAMLANEHPDLAERAVVKVYPFDEDLKHYGGDELLAEVEAALPDDATVTAEEALSMVQINPVVVPALIGEIATYRAEDAGETLETPPLYDEKIEWVMDWLRSFGEAGAEVFTFQPVIDGTGAYYSHQGEEVIATPSLDGVVIDEMPELTSWQLNQINGHANTLLNFENDAVNMAIADQLREEFPEIALMGGYRMDDFVTAAGTDDQQQWIFNPGNGNIVEVAANWSYLGQMFLATPGNPVIQHYGDIILTDNPDQEILDLAGTDQFWDQTIDTTNGVQANRQATGTIGQRWLWDGDADVENEDGAEVGGLLNDLT